MNYATKEDLAAWLGYETSTGAPDVAPLPENVNKLIRDASRLMDYTTRLNPIDVYNELHRDAAMNAVCAQCEYWIDGVGESVDINPDVANYSAGASSFNFVDGKMPKLAPRARRELYIAGFNRRGAAGVVRRA